MFEGTLPAPTSLTFCRPAFGDAPPLALVKRYQDATGTGGIPCCEQRSRPCGVLRHGRRIPSALRPVRGISWSLAALADRHDPCSLSLRASLVFRISAIRDRVDRRRRPERGPALRVLV